MLAPHPAAAGRFDALWIAGGRVVDWGPLPSEPAEIHARSATALRSVVTGAAGGWLPATEVEETRIVGAWIAAHQPPALELGRTRDAGRIDAFVAAARRTPAPARREARSVPR